MRVPITRVDPTLPLPNYATEGSAGFDLIIRTTTTVEAGGMARLPANVITVRSSTPRRTGLRLANGVGIVDQDYAGPDDEIHIEVWNPTSAPVVVQRGDRIAQGVFVRIAQAEWNEQDATGQPTRGGFGSTG